VIFLKKISEFEVNAEVEGHFIIKSVDLKEARNKSKYLDIVLMDNTGTIEIKLWDCSPTQIDWYKKHEFVYVKGLVTEYLGTKQLKVDKMNLAQEDLSIADFVPSIEEDVHALYHYVEETSNNIQNQYIKSCVLHILEIYGDKLKTYPAARHMHHALQGGLLLHVTSMLKIAELVSDSYPFLNKDLLYAGIILHDICKIEEMKVELGQVVDYSVQGQLLGHITLGINLIETFFQTKGYVEADAVETKQVLQHLILSHHEKPEWGSPVAPMMPEAIMLSMIDQMDAKMYAVGKEIKKEATSSYWTEPVKSFGNRRLYVWK
jgi:3'-5' exoribonuclease